MPVFRKSVMSIKFPPVILGPEMAAPILWAPGILGFFLLENPHAHKIPPFRGEGGGCWVFLEGGVEVTVLFLWAWGFFRCLQLLDREQIQPKAFLHKDFLIPGCPDPNDYRGGRGQGYPDVWVPDVPGISCPKPMSSVCFSVLPWAICRNVLEDFCFINFGGFSRGFSWRIFLGTVSHKNEAKKSGEKIREKIRRLKNKNPRNIHSAESRP